jgi:hypothetical protein
MIVKRCKGRCKKRKPAAEFYTTSIQLKDKMRVYIRPDCIKCALTERHLRHYYAAGHTLGTS